MSNFWGAYHLRVLTKVFTSYSLKYLRVLIETSTSYSFYCCCYWRAPTGRYSCIAQGTSPGFSVLKHLLSPGGAAQPQSKCPNTRVVSAAPKGAHLTFICRYPGFHFGLCPHSTLGFAGVSPLQGSSMLSPPINYFVVLMRLTCRWAISY